MVAPFGSFRPLCHTVPSYPICNLFFRQVHILFVPISQSLSYPLAYFANLILIGEYVRNQLWADG